MTSESEQIGRDAWESSALEQPARTMQAHPEGDGIDAERPRSLRRREVFPSHQQQRLAVDVGERGECLGECGIDADGLRWFEAGLRDGVQRHASMLVPSLREDDAPSAPQEPRQRIVGRDVVETPPRDRHALGSDVVGISRATPPRVACDRVEVDEHTVEATLVRCSAHVAHRGICGFGAGALPPAINSFPPPAGGAAAR